MLKLDPDFVGIAEHLAQKYSLALLSNDYLVEYVPIPYSARIGSSKFHPIRDTVNFLGLILRTFMYYAPLKVFVPVSLAFILAGLAKTTFDVWVYQA